MMICDDSAKMACSGKFWFRSYSRKSSRPIKLQHSSVCNISLLDEDMKIKFGQVVCIQNISMLKAKMQLGVVGPPSHAHFLIFTISDPCFVQKSLYFGQILRFMKLIIVVFIFVWFGQIVMATPIFINMSFCFIFY